MNLHLRIDRLVLEGTDLTPRDRARLQAALGSELAALLRSRGLSRELAQGLALPSLPLPVLALRSVPDASGWGLQIAQHLASALAAPSAVPSAGPDTLRAQP
ncbi:MAG TPA: hypothetical protein VJ549_03810 [Geothrix sp.]|nr:hypothetical protein [Geothrix sp.]